VEKGTNINAKNTEGKTPLDLVELHNTDEEVKKFLRDAGGKSGKDIK
jgi:hypothetical protein